MTEILLKGVPYDKVKEIERYTYGVRVENTGEGVKIIISSKSGVRPEYYDLIIKRMTELGYPYEKAVYMVTHNQIPIPIIMVLVAGAIGAAFLFTHTKIVSDPLIIIALLVGLGIAIYFVSR